MSELYIAVAERKELPRFFQVYDFDPKTHKDSLERITEAGDSVALFLLPDTNLAMRLID